MKLKRNIGIMNALLRITCGLTILAWSTSRLTRRPWRESYLFIAMLGAMKVGEGILQYCPLTDMYERTTENQNNNDQNKMMELPSPSDLI